MTSLTLSTSLKPDIHINASESYVEYEDSSNEEIYAVVLQTVPDLGNLNDLSKDEIAKNAVRILYGCCKKIIFFGVLSSVVNEIGEKLKNNGVKHILLAYGNNTRCEAAKTFDEKIQSILQLLHSSNDYQLECVALSKSGKKRPINLSNQDNAVKIYQDNHNNLVKLKICKNQKGILDVTENKDEFCAYDYINEFINESKNDGHRYRSFDYCYTYFADLEPGKHDMEKSCYVLMAFLASWGMLRGSSVLLSKNVISYKPIIEFIIRMKKEGDYKNSKKTKFEYYRTLDLTVDGCDEFANNVAELILELMPVVEELYTKDNGNIAEVCTGITKILMGIFGYPALDSYVMKAFEIKGFNHESDENEIAGCYQQIVNKYKIIIVKCGNIQEFNCEIIRFDGTKSSMPYSQAKLMDIYGFKHGYYLSKFKS